MTRYVLLALALWPLAGLAQSIPQWEVLDASPSHGYRFEDASFVTPEAGWIVNGSGEVWSTADGGASWGLRSISAGYLRTVTFPTPSRGWVGVLRSPTQLYETQDGGATLTDITHRISPSVGGGICGLWALDETTVFGVGEWDGPAYFIKTTDGGATWQSKDMGAHAGSLIDVYFTDPLNGLAVGGTDANRFGGRVVVLATHDGGETWTERFRSSGGGTSGEWAWKISFPSPLVGYVSVEHFGGAGLGKVLKTTDGGVTWTELFINGGDSFQGVGFISDEVGWASGRGLTMRTLDGGATWQEDGTADGAVNRFEFFGDSLGYAMGQRVYRLSRPSSTAGETPPEAAGLRLEAWPNPAAGALRLRSRWAPAGEVTVYDALGRRVARLRLDARGEARWERRGIAPGVYLARVATGDATATARLVLR